MHRKIVFLVLILGLTQAFASEAATLLVTSQNLEDFSFTTSRRSDGSSCWKIHMLVAGKGYSHFSCEEKSEELWAILKQVIRSPFGETCVLREWCNGNSCSREYGQKMIDARVKLVHNEHLAVQRFFDLTTRSRCE